MPKMTTKMSFFTSLIVGFVSVVFIAACGKNGDHGSKKFPNEVCKSDETLDLQKLNAERIETMKSASPGGDDKSVLFVVRTWAIEDKMTSESFPINSSVINLNNMPSQLNATAFEASGFAAELTDKNCETLEITYKGPGLAEPLRGHIIGMSHRAARIEAISSDSQSKIFIELKLDDVPNRSRGDQGKNRDFKNSWADGRLKLTVLIRETVSGGEERQVKIIQESVLNKDVEVKLHMSIMHRMFGQLQVRRNGAAASPRVQQLSAKFQDAQQNNSDTMPVMFSELLSLKEAIDGQPAPTTQPADPEQPDPQAGTPPTDDGQPGEGGGTGGTGEGGGANASNNSSSAAGANALTAAAGGASPSSVENKKAADAKTKKAEKDKAAKAAGEPGFFDQMLTAAGQVVAGVGTVAGEAVEGVRNLFKEADKDASKTGATAAKDPAPAKLATDAKLIEGAAHPTAVGGEKIVVTTRSGTLGTPVAGKNAARAADEAHPAPAGEENADESEETQANSTLPVDLRLRAQKLMAARSSLNRAPTAGAEVHLSPVRAHASSTEQNILAGGNETPTTEDNAGVLTKVTRFFKRFGNKAYYAVADNAEQATANEYRKEAELAWGQVDSKKKQVQGAMAVYVRQPASLAEQRAFAEDLGELVTFTEAAQYLDSEVLRLEAEAQNTRENGTTSSNALATFKRLVN